MKKSSSVVTLEIRETYKILLVDDDPTDQLTIKHMLSLGVHANYRVTTLNSIPEAKTYLSEHSNRVDLIFLDYHLVEHTAEDLLEFLHESDIDLPVIVASSFATKNKENRLLQYGIYDFWDKNLLNPQTLEHTVRFALNRHQLSHKKYHKQLLQERTLASVIHDIKSPASTISSYNKIAQKIILSGDKNISDNSQNYERLAACYDTIDKNCQLLHHIIDELLDLTKIQNVGQQITKEPINIVDIAKACCQAFRPQAEENQLKLTLDTKENCLLVSVNAEKLTQAFNNLLSNAIKYTDAGTISVSIKRHWNHQTAVALIEIIDTGIGIAAEDIPKIFLPFNKIDHKTLKPIDSHGLGLSITKGIIEMFGGNIKVYSNLGVGSRFCIKLPLVK